MTAATHPTESTYTRADFDCSPFVVFYEVTRACDLVCQHCRACAQPLSDPRELATDEAIHLLDDLARFAKPPLLVLTGGDPLKRQDVFELVSYGVERGLNVAMTPSATPLVSAAAIERLRDVGLSRLALSLDGADAATHDAFRGVAGSFARTMEIIEDAQQFRVPLQINTTITTANVEQIDAMADMLAGFDVVLWSVFFLVPVGRGQLLQRISAEQYEAVFERLWRHSRRGRFAVKTTEAPHYRRFHLRLKRDAGNRRPQARPPGLRAPLGVNDGKGVMFVGHAGVIQPSGFLPIPCGTFPEDSVVDVYQSSPVFRALRDADRLQGKCGACEYRHVCGGSRARAFAVSGDLFAEEPDCNYVPRRFAAAK